MIIAFLLLLLSVALFWINYRILNRDYFKSIENFATLDVKEFPIIGHLHIFFWKSPHEKIRTLCVEALKTEKTAKLWFLSKLVIILNTPKDVQTVLNSQDCLEKGSPYNVLVGAGTGLITAKPSKWRIHRRLLNTPFTVHNVLKQISTINQISRNLVEDLIPFCDRDEISLIDGIGHRIMDIALSVLFDYRFDKSTLIISFTIIEKCLRYMGNRLVKFYTAIIVVFIEKILHITPPERKLLYGLAQLLDAAFVACKQNYMPEIEGDAQKIHTDDDLRNRPDRFLKRLYRVAFHNRMTAADMEENIGQFLVAATDTTSTAIGNIILCLAAHREVQEKLYTELKSVMTDDDELDLNKISQLGYLDRVIKESMRVLPLLPIVIRKASANIQLEDGIIPAGTDILVPIYNLHRRASIWGPNVNIFNPDNFLPGNIRSRHPCSFIPFSYGPRNCIGYKYGLILLRIVIAHMILNFQFRTKLKLNDLKFEYGISVKPETGYMVSLNRRS